MQWCVVTVQDLKTKPLLEASGLSFKKKIWQQRKMFDRCRSSPRIIDSCQTSSTDMILSCYVNIDLKLMKPVILPMSTFPETNLSVKNNIIVWYYISMLSITHCLGFLCLCIHLERWTDIWIYSKVHCHLINIIYFLIKFIFRYHY